MSKKSWRRGAFAVVLASAAVALPSAAGASFIATATLSGANQVPPVSTPAVGAATITYDSGLNTLTYQVTYLDLSTPLADGHIHVAPAGSNGPVVVRFENLPLGATSATFGGVARDADLTGALGLTTVAQVAAQIEAGNAYVNLHSEGFPAGELRGQLAVMSMSASMSMPGATSVPEPASLALLGVGVLAAVAARRSGRTPLA